MYTNIVVELCLLFRKCVIGVFNSSCSVLIIRSHITANWTTVINIFKICLSENIIVELMCGIFTNPSLVRCFQNMLSVYFSLSVH